MNPPRSLFLSVLPGIFLSAILAFGVVGLVVLPLPGPVPLQAGCSPAQQAKEASGGVKLALCVLAHEGETPEQITAACAPGALEDVTKILDAQRASRERYAAKVGCPAVDAGSRTPSYGPGK